MGKLADPESISMQWISTLKLVADYNMPTDKEAMVTNLIPGSEAYESGIEVGDII